MRKWIIVLVVLIFLAVIFIIFSFREIFGGETDALTLRTTLNDNDESATSENNNGAEKDSSANGFNNDGGGSSGGGNGGSNGGNGQEQECKMTQISYSMENFQQNSTCNQYDGQTCINKEISCSIDIRNLDYEISGLFKVENYFIKKGDDRENAFDETLNELMISPRSSEHLTSSTNIQGPLADETIDCVFHTISAPEKETCI